MSRKAVESLEKTDRRAGVLLHPTSLPSPYGIGDMGEGAYQFIDFLKEAGQKFWQILPLGPTGYGDSPYQSFSAFAGQPLIISLKELVKDGFLFESDFQGMKHWSPAKIDFGEVIPFKNAILKKAYERFLAHNIGYWKDAFDKFCKKEADWLDDYSLFMAGKDEHGGESWLTWEDDLRDPNEEVKSKWRSKLKDLVTYYKFIQFIFFRQWLALKKYANQNGISIIGDIPIFVALDSADVWANKEFFQLDKDGYPTCVAGVPPDYFSETGQLWGNPLYDWEAIEKDNFRWWIKRIQAQLSLVDYLRIDHFRGFEAYWAVPYEDTTAIGGKWKKGPYKDLFYAIQDALGENIPIFAEDLGVITPEVEELRDYFHFPGMKILQFGFNNTEENGFLPHYYPVNCICYTGTHDNDTTIGWFQKASHESRKKCLSYMNMKEYNDYEVCWGFIRMAYASTAKYAIIPLQDLLCKGSEDRMNTPSTASGNWRYRYQAGEITQELKWKLQELCWLYGRH